MARGYSSVGRALPLQGRRQRFESAYLQPTSFRRGFRIVEPFIENKINQQRVYGGDLGT